MEVRLYVCSSFSSLHASLIVYRAKAPWGGGGDSHTKQMGMLVGNFEFNP